MSPKSSMIRHSYLLILVCGLLLSGCKDKNTNFTKRPENLIPKEKLSKILLDVYIAEAALYIKTQKGIDLGLYTTVYYNSIYKKHLVTRKQYLESLIYYLETDNNASTLFLEVINHLVSIQKSADGKAPPFGEGQKN